MMDEAKHVGENDVWDDDEGRIKRELLANSKPFDVHTWSDYPEVNEFVDQIYEERFKARKKEVRKRHLKVLLLDLFVNWCEDPERYIAIYRDANAYKAGTRYNELKISKTTIKVLDDLLAAEFIEQEMGFYNREIKRGKIVPRQRQRDQIG